MSDYDVNPTRMTVDTGAAMPQDVEAEASVVQSLSGIVSQETLLGLLSCVDEPKKEIERMADEKEQRVQSSVVEGFPTNRLPEQATTETEETDAEGNVQP